MKAEDARKLIEVFEGKSPEACRLARAVSLAAHVETELLRAVRLGAVPEADAGSEADLWFSPFVATQNTLALVLRPAIVEVLREQLAADGPLLGAAWEVIKEFHEKAAPALRLEEEVTFLALSGAAESEIEARLHSVLAAMRKEQRAGLARWAARALPTLPERARSTEAARVLSVAAGIQTGGGPVLHELPRRGATLAWLSQFTAKNIGTVKVGLRYLKNAHPAQRPPSQEVPADAGAAAPPAEEPPMLVEFSYPPPTDLKTTVDVPDTYRLLLEVSWGDGEAARAEQLSLLPRETRSVPVGYGEVRIRTALGDLHTLRPHFDYDFSLIYGGADSDLADRLLSRLQRHEWRGRRLRVFGIKFQRLGRASSAVEHTLHAPLEEDIPDDLDTGFRGSRKVGFLLSPRFTPRDFYVPLDSRPEPQVEDWIIPLDRGAAARPPWMGGQPALDFTTDARFDESFRALWEAITGERLAAPPPPRRKAASQGQVEIFCAYAHEDENLHDRLDKHLTFLQRQGVIAGWHDRKIEAGDDWAGQINAHLDSAAIILMLVSADFIASDYCYSVEMYRALERHDRGEAVVIPVILRPVDWESSPLGRLQALPRDAMPVTSWRDHDEAFNNVAQGIREIAREIQSRQQPGPTLAPIPRRPAFGYIPRRDESGRDIVERLKEELAPGRSRLVTLSGPGGIGKTTLAAEAATSLLDVYAGRVVWSTANGRTDFALISLLDDIATQLGRPQLRTLAPEPKAEQVRALVSDPPALVVLDNYETIAPEEQRRIEAWFAQAPCSALFTSRARVANTAFVRVSAMTREEADEFLDSLVRQAQDPQSFTPDVRRRIYETAEANPFIMQWVVAQIDLAQEPADVLAQLSAGEGDAAERVFGRSFDLPQLGDEGRDALFALSLFTPSASRPALAEVAGLDERRLNEAVKNLSALWLIKALDGGRRLAVEGLTRLLVGARYFGETHAGEIRRRFVSYFLRYAGRHSERTAENYDALEAEKENFSMTAELAASSQDFESVITLADVLADPASGVLSVRGYWDEAAGLTERALEAARSSRDEGNVSALNYNLAVMYDRRGEPAKARDLLRESLEIEKRRGNESGVAVMLLQLGRLARGRDELEEARRLYDESLEISRKLGDEPRVAATLYEVGVLAQLRGEFEEARRLYVESLEISRKLGDTMGAAVPLQGLGALAEGEGDLVEARRLYEESLEITKRLNNLSGIAESLRALGALARRSGDIEQARARLEEFLSISHRLKDERGVAAALAEMGAAFADQGERGEAGRLLRQALDIYERLGSPAAENVRRMLAQLGPETA